MPAPRPYVGRFAPSPTGLLHLGSLTCALASYLDARQHGGRWLLRIEDIDPPREQPGASAAIIRCLAAHGLESDGPILWQSQRSAAYHESLDWLADRQLTYPCDCSRARLANLHSIYDGHCRQHPASHPAALRLKTRDLPAAFQHISSNIVFQDRHRGERFEDLASTGDFIIHRKDGLFAYQLAVVVDDIAQNITHVVRGNDLLETTARQIFLFNLLGAPTPRYCHIPVVSNELGQKLSKQNLALPLNEATPSANLWCALKALGANPPANLLKAKPRAILDWGEQNWSPSQLSTGNMVPGHTLSPALEVSGEQQS